MFKLLRNYIVILALLLTACGFHLRGSGQADFSLGKLYLDGGSGQLREQFTKALKASGDLVNSPEQANVVVKVLDEYLQRRVLSTSARGKANEYELVYFLKYEISDAKHRALGEQPPIEIRRSYFNDQQDIIAKDGEEQVIRGEMYQQAMRSVSDRIRFSQKQSPK
ncbi:MAG: LPS assembly lipoprotein LptE [Methylococcaceae bacterium]